MKKSMVFEKQNQSENQKKIKKIKK